MKKMLLAAVITLSATALLYAHCEIPCGIYQDALRTAQLYEDIATIEKCVTEIKRLSAEKEINYNQLVRWINNKDLHAQKIQDTVCTYFMLQRIAPLNQDDPGYVAYVARLTLLHRLLVDAMKAKQNVDPAIPARMRATLKAFEQAYPQAALPQEEPHHH